jgi:hypothetical protein
LVPGWWFGRHLIRETPVTGAGAVRGTVVRKRSPRRLIMKKLVLAAVLSAFSFTAAATYACDGMKGHAKGDKTDQSDTQSKKDTKDTKSDTKS